MRTIKVRDLRGSVLEQYCRNGDLVGIMRDRALVAVVVPMLQHWMEHLLEHNWSRVYENAQAAEVALRADKSSIVGLDSALWRCATGEAECAGCAQCEDGTRVASIRSLDAMGKLRMLFGAGGDDDDVDFSAVDTIRVGVLSANRIQRASDERKLLVLTNDGTLIGIVVPVSQRVVEFLVAQNLSRIIYNIQRGEREMFEETKFTSLADALDDDLTELPGVPRLTGSDQASGAGGTARVGR